MVVRKDLAEVQQELQKLEAVPVVAADAKGGEPGEKDARAHREVLIARENWLAAQLELYGDPPMATQRTYEEYGPPAPPAEDELPVDGDGGSGGSSGETN